MAKAGKTGVSSTTPKNIVFGAGTIHKNLKYTNTSWNFDDSIIGATQGGSKLTITPEYTKISADGALVAAKGLTVKTGETATMEVNLLELTADVIKMAAAGKAGTSADTAYNLIESKAAIADGDYLENIAYVGETLEGKKIIAILENAICTNGLNLDKKDKESGAIALTFECHADLTSDLDTLPWKIYFPKPVA